MIFRQCIRKKIEFDLKPIGLWVFLLKISMKIIQKWTWILILNCYHLIYYPMCSFLLVLIDLYTVFANKSYYFVITKLNAYEFDKNVINLTFIHMLELWKVTKISLLFKSWSERCLGASRMRIFFLSFFSQTLRHYPGDYCR